MRKLFYLSLFLAFWINIGIVAAQPNDSRYPLIPYPRHITPGMGSFVITPATVIVTEKTSRFINEAKQLNQLLAKGIGKQLVISHTTSKRSIALKYNAAITAQEGYWLTIKPQQIVLEAKDPAGMFRGVETIRQLLPADVELSASHKTLSLPAAFIRDEPAFSWRGMHLDVARHFFSPAYLKKFIDLLALYKMNTLHLHLTDDQGWRIEIKKYPKLTEQGAWREFNNQDSVCIKRSADNPDMAIDPSHIIHRNGKTLYGGFYTQAQMKDVIAFAAARHIDIIPEIDMPGHMMAAINAYPFLTCNGENSWGKLFTKPICPCNETTFEFAENIFSEIMEVFPSKYIHIGGDEVDRSDWAKSDACKELMAKQGITNTAGLQSYFINRMEKYFNAHGRKLIGWDEVLEGGVTPSAYIMYWRTWVPGAPLKAAKNGNHVIMVSGNPLYFDGKYDKNSAGNVYHFDPIPKGLTTDEAKLIVGAQAAIWTEYVPSEKRADYQAMPRMTALAELLWTNDVSRYDSYLARSIAQFARLDNLNVNYRLPDLEGMVDDKIFVATDTVNIKSPLPSSVVRFTVDGTIPSLASPVLNNYVVKKPQVLNIALFTNKGRRGDVYTVKYKQQNYAGPVPATVHDGLKVDYYPGDFNSAARLTEKPPADVLKAYNIAVPQEVKAPSFGLRYRGYIDVPQQGIYTFFLTCDDAGILKINGETTVDNDGMHSPVEKSGQAALKGGLHPFELDFVEGGGGYTLKLQYSLNGSAPKDIPSKWLKN